VKKLALRGCSHVGALHSILATLEERGPTLFADLSGRAFDASLAGLDDPADRNEQLALESVVTLNSLVCFLDRAVIESRLPKMLLRVKSCFEKENSPSLRTASFSLFGKLANCAGHTDLFRESVHSNIVSILLHVNDVEEDVKMSCVETLIGLAPVFTSPYMVTLIQRSLSPNTLPPDYLRFLEDFCSVLVVSFPDRANYYVLSCTNYFKSQSVRMRANSVSTAGFLLAALSAELWSTISKDLVFSGFVQLLRDPAPEVRVATASAIASLNTLT